jgi:hypothetical protein
MKGLEQHSAGTVLSVRVVPRAKKSSFAGWHGEALKIRLAAPPVEGKANEALIAFLSKALGVRRQKIELLSGARSRHKRVLIRDLPPAEVVRLLALE